jgi:hypothetical protein
MGFTIQTYQLLGLPSLPNIYVTIKGSYSVKKQLNTYIITFTTYFQASPEYPVITQKDMSFSIQVLPNPAVLYKIIYDYIKGQLSEGPPASPVDPYYATEQQALVFQDD